MRRYTTEIKGKSKEMPGCAQDFGKNLKDICGYDVTVEGNDIFSDGEQCGQFFALSTAAKAKGLFPDKNLYNIVFDEFLIDNPRYSYIGGYNEPFELMKAIDSLLRPTPLHDVGRVIMLSNSVKLGNPYFLYFNIPNIETGIYFDKNRRLLVEFDYNESFRTLRESTSFGKLTLGTTYNDYAMSAKRIARSGSLRAKESSAGTDLKYIPSIWRAYSVSSTVWRGSYGAGDAQIRPAFRLERTGKSDAMGNGGRGAAAGAAAATGL